MYIPCERKLAYPGNTGDVLNFEVMFYITYFSLGMHSNDTDDEAATVMLFGLIKIKRLGLDIFDLSESINFDY